MEEHRKNFWIKNVGFFRPLVFLSKYFSGARPWYSVSIIFQLRGKNLGQKEIFSVYELKKYEDYVGLSKIPKFSMEAGNLPIRTVTKHGHESAFYKCIWSESFCATTKVAHTLATNWWQRELMTLWHNYYFTSNHYFLCIFFKKGRICWFVGRIDIFFGEIYNFYENHVTSYWFHKMPEKLSP